MLEEKGIFLTIIYNELMNVSINVQESVTPNISLPVVSSTPTQSLLCPLSF